MQKRKETRMLLYAVVFTLLVITCSLIYSTLSMTVSFAAQNQGTYGRLVIPDEHISVKLNTGKSGLNQFICDKLNSAVYIEDDQRIIADHSTQGFARLKKSVPGKTTAYLIRGDKTEEYICRKVLKGHNTLYELTDEHYEPVRWSASDGVITYTCNGSWQNVLIVLWEPK